MFLFQPVLHRRPVHPRGYGRTFCNRFSQVYPKITASFDNSIVIFIGRSLRYLLWLGRIEIWSVHAG